MLAACGLGLARLPNCMFSSLVIEIHRNRIFCFIRVVKLGQLLGLLSSMVSTSDKRKKTGDTTFTNYFVSGESESVLVLVLKLRSCLPFVEENS